MQDQYFWKMGMIRLVHYEVRFRETNLTCKMNKYQKYM
jgi:hypothetical protein